VKIIIEYPEGGYPTFRNYVLLHKVKPTVRKRALKAGLIPTSVKEYKKLIGNTMALNRVFESGIWYDTVKYAV